MKVLNRFFRHSIAALATGALLLGLAACGGDDGGDGEVEEQIVFGAERESGILSIVGDVVKIRTGLGAIVQARKAADPSQYFIRAPGGGGLYSAEVEILIQDQKALAKPLVEGLPLIELARAMNQETRLPFAALQEQEAAWTEAEGDNDFVARILANETSVMLKEFQAATPGAAELIATNKRGFILGTTNATERFDQTRNLWWFRGYNEGQGGDFHDDIQINENLGIQGVSIYIAIIDPEKVRAAGDTLSASGLTFRDRPTDQAIGVLKIFVPLDWMKEQLGVADTPSATP